MKVSLSFGSLALQIAFAATSNAQQVRQLTMHEEARIDGEAYGFSRIVHLSVGDSGSVIVAQPDDGTLRFFDAKGVERASFGRKGEGPGEFRSIGIYRGWKGTSFWQADILLRRATIFGRSFKLDSIVLLPAIRSTGSFTLPAIIGMPGNGDLLVHALFRRTENAPSWAAGIGDRPVYVVVRITSRGEVIRLLGSIPQVADGCMTLVNGRNRPVPQCAEPYSAVAPMGDYYAEVFPTPQGERPGTFTVTATAADGQRIFRSVLPFVPRRIGKVEADSIRQALIAGTKSELLARDYRDMPLPEVFRPIHGIIASSDGNVWVALRPDKRGRPWMRISRLGRPTGSITAPYSTTLHVINGSFAWGVSHDEDGVPSVVRYRITG